MEHAVRQLQNNTYETEKMYIDMNSGVAEYRTVSKNVEQKNSERNEFKKWLCKATPEHNTRSNLFKTCRVYYEQTGRYCFFSKTEER